MMASVGGYVGWLWRAENFLPGIRKDSFNLGTGQHKIETFHRTIELRHISPAIDKNKRRAGFPARRAANIEKRSSCVALRRCRRLPAHRLPQGFDFIERPLQIDTAPMCWWLIPPPNANQTAAALVWGLRVPVPTCP